MKDEDAYLTVDGQVGGALEARRRGGMRRVAISKFC